MGSAFSLPRLRGRRREPRTNRRNRRPVEAAARTPIPPIEVRCPPAASSSSSSSSSSPPPPARSVDPQQILRDYNEGRRSAQQVIGQLSRTHHPEGEAATSTHWLWDISPNSGTLFAHCLRYLSETKVFELLQALVEENPHFPLCRGRYGTSFLDAALNSIRQQWGPGPGHAASRHILLLLAVPGTTRRPSGGPAQLPPLHNACSIPEIDPEIVHRLLDLDPDVLMERDITQSIPLHRALRNNPTAPFIERMVQLRPESLLVRNYDGFTPIVSALDASPWDANEAAAAASVLEGLIRRCPGSVPLSGHQEGDDAALLHACRSFPAHPKLIRAIVSANPTDLGVPSLRLGQRDYLLLPFELVDPAAVPAAEEEDDGHTAATATATLALLETETLEMALAVVEYAVGFDDEKQDDGTMPTSESDSARYFGHVRRVATAFLPPSHHRGAGNTSTSSYSSSSGIEVAQALCRTLGVDNNDNDRRRRMDLCRVLFRGSVDAAGSAGSHSLNAPFLLDRRVLTGNSITISGLYRLNRRGRLNPSVSHQLDLLESVKDDLDCIFLHLRVAGNLLLPPLSAERIRRRPVVCYR